MICATQELLNPPELRKTVFFPLVFALPSPMLLGHCYQSNLSGANLAILPFPLF